MIYLIISHGILHDFNALEINISILTIDQMAVCCMKEGQAYLQKYCSGWLIDMINAPYTASAAQNYRLAYKLCDAFSYDS